VSLIYSCDKNSRKTHSDFSYANGYFQRTQQKFRDAICPDVEGECRRSLKGTANLNKNVLIKHIGNRFPSTLPTRAMHRTVKCPRCSSHRWSRALAFLRRSCGQMQSQEYSATTWNVIIITVALILMLPMTTNWGNFHYITKLVHMSFERKRKTKPDNFFTTASSRRDTTFCGGVKNNEKVSLRKWCRSRTIPEETVRTKRKKLSEDRLAVQTMCLHMVCNEERMGKSTATNSTSIYYSVENIFFTWQNSKKIPKVGGGKM